MHRHDTQATIWQVANAAVVASMAFHLSPGHRPDDDDCSSIGIAGELPKTVRATLIGRKDPGDFPI